MQQTQTITLYAQLSDLLGSYRKERFSSNHLKTSFEFSQALLDFVRNDPDPVSGQLLFYKRQLPYITNLTFNACLLTALLCYRNKINETCSQQLICSVISIYAFQQADIEKHARNSGPEPNLMPQPELQRALKKVQLDVWSCGYQIGKSLSLASLRLKNIGKTFLKLQKIVLAAHLIAIQITPRKNIKSLNLAKAIKKVVQRHSYLLTDTVTPMLHYPGLIPAGSTVRLDNQSIALVLSSEPGHLVIKERTHESYGHVHSVSEERITQVGAAQPANQDSPIHAQWDKEWREYCEISHKSLHAHDPSFRLDRPPPVLLEVQKQLSNDQVDIDKIANIIAKEPSLVEHLRSTATSSNRQNLPIQEVKHGLLIHGYQRATSLLIQQALILRLNQNYFPLQEQFIQFTRLRMYLASILLGNNSLMAERAATLACFACAGLFTCQQFKGRRNWQIKRSKSYDISSLSLHSEQSSLNKHALVLASAWQQPAAELKALDQQHIDPSISKGNSTVRALAACMGLSLILSRQIYFAESELCQESQEYLKQACNLLNINGNELTTLQSGAVEYCHLYCPLDA